METTGLQRAVLAALILALFVVMLGAYTRLTDAGLGCPDWPGCYGQMVLPQAEKELQHAQKVFPSIPIESRKAWTEMAHRYAAGTLALLVLGIALETFRKIKSKPVVDWKIPTFLIALLIFQALLGMWTVTLKLLPVVVMGHLLGGILIFSFLCRLYCQIKFPNTSEKSPWRFFLYLGFIIAFIQIALGGWVSSNYAGIACIGFPKCNGFWVPELHFSQGFNLFSPIGANYQGGLLDSEARASIQFIHRLGALITALYLLILSLFILRRSSSQFLRRIAWIISALVLIQFILGIINVLYLLPLPIAVAHNGVAALLLASILSALYFSRENSHE